MTSGPAVELGEDGGKGVPDQEDGSIKHGDGFVAELVGLDDDDRSVGDALGRKTIFEQGIVLVDTAGEDAWNKQNVVSSFSP